MLDYRYLKAFQVAAKCLNFRKAAAELTISPSALGRQIEQLEAGYGCELFIRSTRKVLLTPAGLELFKTIERFAIQIEDLKQEKSVRIGCLQSIFEFVLIDLIKRFPKVFNGPLDITIGTPETLNEMMCSGQLDLLLTNIEPSASHVSVSRLFQENVSWIGTHSIETRPIVFSAFERFYPEADLRLPNRIRINSFNATVAMARQKIGRALIAKPIRGEAKKKAQGLQWIYLVIPNYQKLPENIHQIVMTLKREFSVK